MHFSRKNQDKLLEQAKPLTGSAGWATDAVAFGAFRENETEPAALAVFQAFNGAQAELHFALTSTGRMTREIIGAICTLAFHPRALNLDRLWTNIADDNIPAQAAAMKVGFKFEYRKRGGFADGKDAIVFSMARTGTHQAAAKHHDNEVVT